MSGPVGSLMRAAFGKSEEMTTGRPEVSGCRQFFVVPNANCGHKEDHYPSQIERSDGERGGVRRHFFLFGKDNGLPYVHTS